MTPNIADIIRHHVSLEVRCIDRLYAHAYMPKLQTSGGLCYFLHDHLGHPIPSPALFRPMHDRFVAAVDAFVARHEIPIVEFASGQDKDAIVKKYRAHFTAREGVVILGVAQEKMRSFKAHKRCGPGKAVTFDFSRQSVSVKHYYFYVHDRDWGPAFIKIGTYLPYRSSSVSTATNGSNSASAAIAAASKASTTDFSRVPILRRCRPPAMRSIRPTFRPSLIAGRIGCHGR
jgi:hypothetical protein